MFCVKHLHVVHSSHPLVINQLTVFRKIVTLRGEIRSEQNTVLTANIH